MLETNRKHFGVNSLFIGVNKSKGICNAILSFSLESIPKNAKIKSAKLYLYPINRVGAKIEKYGEWNLSIINQNSFSDIYDFQQIEDAEIIESIERPLKSKNLTQGIWNNWSFSEYESELLEREIKKNKVIFRVDGPKELPLGEDSQIMQFDIGYGQFGGGLHYRPMLDIKYTIPPSELKVEPFKTMTISKNSIIDDELSSGFDKDGDKIYGLMEFDISQLPNPDSTVITETYIEMKNINVLNKGGDTRFYLELIDMDSVDNYESFKNREKVEYIGYEVASSELLNRDKKYFIFDSYLKLKVEELHKNNKTLKVAIKATSPNKQLKSKIIDWFKENKKYKKPKLIINYINKRKEPLSPVTNVKIIEEKGQIKLTWDTPKDKDFIGCYVVRNSFHPPKLFSDGVKLYGGSDNYTYDNFASLNKDKYYAIFTYDNVPNYSEPVIIKYVWK
jgi:hypothetical protein